MSLCRNLNHVLTHLLTSLERPHHDPRLSELVIQILKACPDQLHWYLPHLKDSVTPRPSPQWHTCVDFILKVSSLPSFVHTDDAFEFDDFIYVM